MPADRKSPIAEIPLADYQRAMCQPPPYPAGSVRVMLQADLRSAMRDRDTRRIRALRGLIAAIDNAEAVPTSDNKDSLAEPAGTGSARAVVTGDGRTEVARRLLSEQQVTAILKGELEAALFAASELRAHGAIERAEEMEAEALVAASYLKDAGP